MVYLNNALLANFNVRLALITPITAYNAKEIESTNHFVHAMTNFLMMKNQNFVSLVSLLVRNAIIKILAFLASLIELYQIYINVIVLQINLTDKMKVSSNVEHANLH